MKTTFKNIFTVLFALFILANCSSCSNNNENDSEFSEEGEDAENQIQAVRVEDLITSDLRKFIELNGNVRAEKSMSVYPIMAGKIAGTNVRLGSKVKKGSVIAYVDPSVPGSRFALNEVIAPISGTVIFPGTNGLVPLSNFASIKKSYSPVAINHENKARTIHITAGIEGNENAPDVEKKIKKVIRSSLVLPSDVSVSFEGSWKNMQKQTILFSKIIVLAILLVFGVMAGMYGSFKKPFINLFTIPFMFIGVLLIYFIIGQSISIMTMVGLVMLVGIVVNNGIVLVDYTGLVVSRGFPVKEACLKAGVSRLRPVLMTTLTTILGMIPMSMTTEGSSSLVQPIGLCVVGGLISSTFVTLVLIPVLYAILCRKEAFTVRENVTANGTQAIANQAGGEKMYRCEIIANQSVEEDIIDSLETSIAGFEYTVDENLYGRGRSSRKLGNSVWPEMNFVLTAYVTESSAEMVRQCVDRVKAIFPREGINLFVIGG